MSSWPAMVRVMRYGMGVVLGLGLACARLGADDSATARDTGVAVGPTRRSPELSRLDPLRGDWSGTKKSAATPVQGADQSPLQASFRWVLGGYHLEGALEYVVAGRSHHVLSFWSFDPSDRTFHVHWIDDSGSVPTDWVGRFERDGSLVLSLSRKVQSQNVRERLRLRLTSPDSFRLEAGNDLHGGLAVQHVFEARRKR